MGLAHSLSTFSSIHVELLRNYNKLNKAGKHARASPYTHTQIQLISFILAAAVKQKKWTIKNKKIFKMSKMSVSKHLARLIISQIRWIEMLRIIIRFILLSSIRWAQSAMLQLRWIWARRKTTFFTIGSGMSEWKVFEGSGLKQNDGVILKFDFDIHSYAFRCWFWRNLPKLTNFENW